MLKRIRTAALEIAYEETGTPAGSLRGFQIVPGVGHNLPQEAPEAFAAAVLSLI